MRTSTIVNLGSRTADNAHPGRIMARLRDFNIIHVRRKLRSRQRDAEIHKHV